MKRVLFFALCLISVPGRIAKSERKLKAFLNGGVLIFCKFGDKFREKQKYFCKGNISTCPNNRLANNSRVFQYENTHRDYLTILITNITSNDTGTYHCGVEDGSSDDPMSLNVKPGDCCDTPISIHGQEGGTVSIRCKYPAESRENTKHFCKQHEKFIESDLIESKPSDINAKYLMSQNENRNIFTVTIHELEMKDAGIYWCGVRTDGYSVALTNKVNLQITGSERQVIQVKGYPRGGIVILCKFGDQRQHNQKYFCKGNATTCSYNRLTRDSDSRFFQHGQVLWDFLTVGFTNLTSGDAGTYHCAENEELHTEVRLSIENDDYCDLPVEETREKGGNVSIACHYPEEYRDHTKHLCEARAEW
ncbi:polymeric immunoglobulin receptor-like [Sardina pilchardus]|uniref:polymeric immunoglobulin receptor-like n=1 Tax=Sardina pilchardus TaxID=27697 RepID=UPI002E0D603E